MISGVIGTSGLCILVDVQVRASNDFVQRTFDLGWTEPQYQAYIVVNSLDRFSFLSFLRMSRPAEARDGQLQECAVRYRAQLIYASSPRVK